MIRKKNILFQFLSFSLIFFFFSMMDSGAQVKKTTVLENKTVPVIGTQPANQSVDAGKPAAFAVVATGNPEPTYQWQVSTNNGSSWANVSNSNPYSGATTNKLAITNAAATFNNYQYRCAVKNSEGTVNSIAAKLTVKSTTNSGVLESTKAAKELQVKVGMPTINTQPANQTVDAGKPAAFTVVAVGTPTPTYQWQVSTNNGSSWANVSNSNPYSGATTNKLAITNAAASFNNYQYRCAVKNSVGTVNSIAAKLTVTSTAATVVERQAVVDKLDAKKEAAAAKTGPPKITTQPGNVTVKISQAATFTVTATGDPAPTYMWSYAIIGTTNWQTANVILHRYTGLPLTTSGFNSNKLTFTPVGDNGLNGYKFRCEVKNSNGTVTSNAATLIVIARPGFTTHPSNQSVDVGKTTTFTIVSYTDPLGYPVGYPTPTYQWQVSTNNGSSWSNVSNSGAYSGATTNKLTITNVTSSLNNYQYRCVATNPAGSTESNTARLTVKSSAPSSGKLTLTFMRTNMTDCYHSMNGWKTSYSQTQTAFDTKITTIKNTSKYQIILSEASCSGGKAVMKNTVTLAAGASTSVFNGRTDTGIFFHTPGPMTDGYPPEGYPSIEVNWSK